MLTNIWYLKMKPYLGTDNGRVRQFSYENVAPQKTVQNSFVSGTVHNGLARFWTICVLRPFAKNGSERFPGVFFGVVFAHVSSISGLLRGKFGCKNFKIDRYKFLN